MAVPMTPQKRLYNRESGRLAWKQWNTNEKGERRLFTLLLRFYKALHKLKRRSK